MLSIRSLIVVLLLLPAHAAPVFVLRDLGLPPGSHSQISDVNDNGVVVGTVSEGTNVTVFTSHDGVATRFSGPGVSAGPNAINNRDQIAGNFNPPPTINEFGSLHWHQQAWTYLNGGIVLLGSNVPPTSEALGINDRGDIVGYIGSKAYILSAPATSMTKDVSWVLKPPPAERFYAINNDRIIVGTKGTAAYRWRGFDPDSAEPLDEGASVRAVNSLGQSVGSGGHKLSGMQPTLWNGTNVTFLGAPFRPAEALDISDSGSIVGTFHSSEPQLGLSIQPYSRAILWTNTLGIDLNSITELPETARLVSAVGVNKFGHIAANMWLGGTNHAVLLAPTAELLGVGEAEFTQPAPGLQPSNSVTAKISMANWSQPVSEVTYTLHRRSLRPGYHFDWDYIPPKWFNHPFRTNVSPTLSTTFTDLPAGQYALGATILDTRGTRVFLQPTFFTVTQPARLAPIRFTLRNEFEYGFAGGAGFTYVVEESIDLVRWTEITDTRGTLGGLFRSATTNLSNKYFRTRIVGSDPEHYGAAMPGSALPGLLSGKTMRFSRYDNQPVYRMSFDDGNVEIDFAEGSPTSATGNYTYELQGGRGIVHISIPGPTSRKIHLVLEFSLADSSLFGQNDWRSSEVAAGQRTERSGRFHFENIPLPPPPLPHMNILRSSRWIGW